MRVIFILIILFVNTVNAAEFAITMDDPNTFSKPLFSSEERNQKILSQLNFLNTKAALFVSGVRVNSDEGVNLLKNWDREGHLIGNHTFSHMYYNNSKLSFEEYSADIMKVEPLIKNLDNFEKIFRFPYLKSGNSKSKRDKVRSFLKSNKYKYGYVTIDASDWYISDRLEKRLEKNPKANIDGYRTYYLNHMWNRATYYDELAQKVIGRSPKHTILIHHNLLNALFLKDLVKHFESKGWKLIDAKEAFNDPIFLQEPNTVPSGESIVWALAKENGGQGLRYPAEDGQYEKEKMDKLGL